jgi:O-antigen/teichoic acid export membrane protein
MSPAHAKAEGEAERLLLAEGSIYTTVDIAQQAITMLMLPIFFFFLSVEDFGVITAAVALSQITTLVSTLGLDFTLLRFYYLWDDDERRELTSGIFYISAMWSVFVGVVVLLARNQIPGAEGRPGFLVLGAWSGLALGLRNVPLSVVRVTGKMRVYAASEIGATVARGTTQLILVWSGFGAWGYLIGYAVSPVVSAVVSFWSIRAVVNWIHPRWGLPTEVWSFTWKGLPSLAVNRLLLIADRIVLFTWSNLESLGIYGVASRFASCLKLLTGGFKMALAPALSRSEAGNRDPGRVYASLSRLLVLTMLSVASAVILAAWFLQFTPWAEHWIDVERLLGILLVAHVLGGFALIWQLGLYYSGKPGIVSIVSGGSGIALVVSLLTLVPLLGSMGAAIAQVIAAVISLVVLAGIEAKEKGHLRAWYQPIALTGLFMPAAIGVWFVDSRTQLYLLLSTFLMFGVVTAHSIWRLWQPKSASI